MAQVVLERRFGHAERPPPIGERETTLYGRERTTDVGEPMLPELGRLYGGEDRGPTRTVCQPLPGFQRFDRPPEPSQEMRPIDADPRGIPGPVEGLAMVPRGRTRPRDRPTTEVRAMTR